MSVSVVIPAYNRASSIEKAVASAWEQQPARPSEVIVVDDASSDGTAERAERAGARVIQHQYNRGSSAARNTGIAAAASEWVALLDSDDSWLPHHLATLDRLKCESLNHPVLIATSALGSSSSSSVRSIWGVGPGIHEFQTPGDLLVRLNYVVTSASMFHRETALDVGGFDENRRLCEDLEFWFRLTERGGGRVGPYVSVLYSVHESQSSADRGDMRTALRDLIAEYSASLWLTRAIVDRAEGAMLWDSLRASLNDREFDDAVSGVKRIVSRPGRLRGALEIVAWRRLRAYAHRSVLRHGVDPGRAGIT